MPVSRGIGKELPLFLLLSLIIAATALLNVWIMLGLYGPGHLNYVALSMEEKPFVLRALLPLLSRGLSFLTGESPSICILFLYVSSSIFLLSSFKYFVLTYTSDERRAGLIAFIGSMIYFIIFLQSPKIYDLATGAFFALCYGLLARGRIGLYLLVFPFMTLNRETSFLMILLFAGYFEGRINRRLWISTLLLQVFMYIVIRGAVTMYFWDAPGELFYFRPMQVIEGYLSDSFRLSLFSLIIGFFLYMAFSGWDRKPGFPRSALLLLSPVLLALHIVFGYAFEIRVFAEIHPILLILISYQRE